MLIARSNSSLAADTISERVLQTINDMQIADEVQLMVDGAMEDLDLEAAVGEEFRLQFAELDLRSDVERLVEEILREKENNPTSPSGLRGAGETDAQMPLENITISGSALIQADLSIGGALQVMDISSTGNIIVEGTVHAAALESESGATLRGRIAIEGDLIINGVPYAASEKIAVTDAEGTQFVRVGTGGAVDVESLTIKDALYVLGDVTIEGFAQFLGDVAIKGSLTLSGSLIVSRNQAGFALIPMGGTGVLISFDPPMAEKPIVTVSSNSFALHRLRAVTETGFTIEVREPAVESIVFSWHALRAKDPFTAEGSAPGIIRKIPFPVDALGYPLSSNSVWNDCIHNRVQLDADGQPFSCSRYHVDNIWTHPDLLIEFTWRSGEKILILPDGFELVVQEVQTSVEPEPVIEEQTESSMEQGIEVPDVSEDPVEDGNAAETPEENTDTGEGSDGTAADPLATPVDEGEPDPATEENVPSEENTTEESVPLEEGTIGDTDVPVVGEQIPDVVPVAE
ncbi:hypothetical protein A3B61_03150 [Candidatus Peribacteria bacterium RIFCSPLOWO2_01_FULL_53_10]|nr:MAG: hypothetical protein A3B61_03150 [Candidatus Peribacteria bacterium RIFCSPLOWO2_01_FULL_53_10]